MTIAIRATILGFILAMVVMLPASLVSHDAWAGRISDIRNTKHNLSSNSGNTVKATGEDEVCVFCHTPHAATQGMTPLWNRQSSSAQYTTYHSSSLDASPGDIGLDQPNGTSKLCLSCHDGTIAIGSVNVLNGVAATGNVAVQNTGTGGIMPDGKGDTSGYTRKLGINLTNDHPISFTYDDTLAAKDGELQLPSTSGGSPRLIDSRAAGYKPKFPLENGKLQCTTCHDPHIRDDDPNEGAIKFLRNNRFQKGAPTGTFAASNDILCLACHTKAGWAKSAHADPTAANETYTAAAATDREFPAGTQVWQAACLNCHDTHTVQGSRRLLREGTDGAVNGQNAKAGGNSAIEETCYQCHSKTGGVNGIVLTGQGGATFEVPDIKSDFTLKTYRMPIADQPEVHDIGNSTELKAGKDFVESPALLAQRHSECTDCHNPHRVMKTKLFNGLGGTTAGTHTHTETTGYTHTNIASGVLRGTWGVEPNYGGATFMTNPTSYTIKRGDPGESITTAQADPYVTREYQVCLKCHSDYAYGATPPNLGYSGGTPSGTNGLLKYTNQAMEFQAPTAAQGSPSTNHRSWHPVMNSTGRTAAIRNAGANNWRSPWNNAVGSQTMYCSDCHGSETASGTGVIPSGNSGTENGNPWGPHGSNNAFILKGPWRNYTGSSYSDDLCFKCHSYSLYATRGGGSSGFGGSKDSNLHSYHADKLGKMRCTWCHVAVPHGWKNKALLVNLNDVGPEVGLAAGTQVRNNTTAVYTNPPYYYNAVLKIKTFANSGSWSEGNCGSKGAPGNNTTGRSWMRDSNERCTGAGP